MQRYPVCSDLLFSGIYWKKTKLIKKGNIYRYIYINSRNNENDEDNDEDNVNDDDGSIKWNYPCKALIIFDEQIILNKKKIIFNKIRLRKLVKAVHANW